LVNEHSVRPSLSQVDAMLIYPIPKNQKHNKDLWDCQAIFDVFPTVDKQLYDLAK